MRVPTRQMPVGGAGSGLWILATGVAVGVWAYARRSPGPAHTIAVAGFDHQTGLAQRVSTEFLGKR